MKPRHLLACVLFLYSEILFGQTNEQGKLTIPFLNQASQNNVVVSVLDILGNGVPCPAEYTNTVSNTNLFTAEEQRLIRGAFVKYTDVTTNSGPRGAKLIAFYKTNVVYQIKGKIVNSERLIGQFQYINSEAKEEIDFSSKAISANFRSGSNDGYNVVIAWTGRGSMLRFTTVRDGKYSGVVAQFDDVQPQSMDWDNRHASFTNSILSEYRQCTNGLAFGKFLLWNVKGRLTLSAEFKKPYDFEKYRVPWP